jgi:hypothetical protein
MLPRLISILLGGALVFSAFWYEPRGTPVFVHDLLIGALVVAIALLAVFVPRARFANTFLALWLFFSTSLFNQMPHFYWTVGVGTLLFISSLASGPARSGHGHAPPGNQQPAPHHA